jgi:Delta7-sterol 5-desaturase
MERSLFVVFLAVAGAQLLRYAVLAGGLFLLAQRHTPDWLKRRRIARTPTTAVQAWREVRYSVGSIALFGLAAVLIVSLRKVGWVAQPESSSAASLLWVPVLLVLQDAYFYATHRAMHHKRLFKHLHLVHHRSVDPSPLAAFSFHPGEAIVEALFAVAVALTFSPPVAALVAFQFISFFINLYGHLGIELLPPGFARSPLFRVLNTTTHHHQHHNTTHHNFGLYFQWWDLLLGTNHPKYEQTFLTNASRGVLPAVDAAQGAQVRP